MSVVREILERTGEVAYRYRLRPELAYEYVSDAIVALVGYTPDEFYADPGLPERIVFRDDLETMRRVLAAPHGQPVEVLLRWIHRDGRVVTTELRCVVLRDAEDRPILVDGVARDITQRDGHRQQPRLISWRGAIAEPGVSIAPARVLIAEDQELMRAGLRMFLSEDPGLTLVGQATDMRALLRLAQALEPDLALIDVESPALEGLDAIRRVKSVSPMTSVLALSTHEDAQLLLDAIKAGAAGWVLKGANETALRSAIWDVLAGDLAVDDRLAREVLRQIAQERSPAQPAPSGPLSAREREVVRLLARGHTNREIAELLTITASTVKIHVEHILAKLVVSDRTQAAVRAIELGYVISESPPP